MKVIMESWRDYLLVESLLTEAALDAESNYIYYKTIDLIKEYLKNIESSVNDFIQSDPNDEVKSIIAKGKVSDILKPDLYYIDISPDDKKNKQYNPSGILNYVRKVMIIITTGASNDVDKVSFTTPDLKGTWNNEYRTLRLNFILAYPQAQGGFGNFIKYVNQSDNFVGSMMKQATDMKPEILETISHELNHAKQGKGGKESRNNLLLKQKKIDEYTDSVLEELGKKIKDFFQAGPPSKILEKEWDKQYQEFIDKNGKDLEKLYKSISWTVRAADLLKGQDEKINPTEKIKKVITFILYHALPSEKESFIVGFYRRARALVYGKKGVYKNKKERQTALAETFFSFVVQLQSNMKDSMHEIIDQTIVDSFKDQAKAIVDEKIDIAIDGMLDIAYDRYPIFKKYINGEL